MNGDYDMLRLTRQVKRLAKRHGAVLVGIAPIERFDPMPPFYDRAPKGHDPRDFLPGAKAVISFAMPILDSVLYGTAASARKGSEMLPPELINQFYDTVYDEIGHELHDKMLQYIGQIIGQYLVSKGFKAVIFPTTGVHPHVDNKPSYEIWKGKNKFNYTFGPFSHRHAAVRAGLGEFGYNNLVVTKEFGPRQRFNSVITDAELIGDPLITEPICLREKCKKCLEACPTGCITMRDDKNVVDYRSVEKADQGQIFIDTPAKSDPQLCMRRKILTDKEPVRGECLRVCPLPIKKTADR